MNWALGVTGKTPSSASPYWQSVTGTGEDDQELGDGRSRYYWVQTYQHWVDLVNITLYDPAEASLSPSASFKTAIGATFTQFYAAWLLTGTTAAFPFATLQNWLDYSAQVPQMTVGANNLFTFYGDSRGYWNSGKAKISTGGVSGAPLLSPTTSAPATLAWNGTTAVAQTVGVAPYASNPAPLFRLFFNSNLYGLFTAFPTLYFNTATTTSATVSYPPSAVVTVGDLLFSGATAQVAAWNATTTYPIGAVVTRSGVTYVATASSLNQAPPNATYWAVQSATVPVPQGTGNIPSYNPYVNEILFPNKFYSNIVDYRVTPYASGGVPPLGYVPTNFQQPYFVVTQEQISTDSLWSPVAAIVLQSTLMLTTKEQVGPPILLNGVGNLGQSSATAAAAFQPIICDVSLDTSTQGAGAYRSFISYEPKAEFRLSDFGASQQPIQSIDVKAYWKYRLTNELFPTQMYNLSSVNFKLMFKKKGLTTKIE